MNTLLTILLEHALNQPEEFTNSPAPFSGLVPQNLTDEPASALLARIRSKGDSHARR